MNARTPVAIPARAYVDGSGTAAALVRLYAWLKPVEKFALSKAPVVASKVEIFEPPVNT